MSDAVTRMRALIGLDPANVMWQRQLASVLEHTARVLRASGRCAAALPMIDEGLATIARIADKAAEVRVAGLTHLALRNDKAACLLAAGRVQEAARILDASLAETAALNQARVDFVAYASALAMTHYLAGVARATSGQLDVAHDSGKRVSRYSNPVTPTPITSQPGSNLVDKILERKPNEQTGKK